MTAKYHKTRRIIFLCLCIFVIFFVWNNARVNEKTKQYTTKMPVHADVILPRVVKSHKDVPYFQKLITNEDMSTYKLLVKKFFDVVPKNVTCFLMYGSLLGAYRHHNVVPWDADVDIFVKVSDLPSVWNKFKSFNDGGNFRMLRYFEFVWRFYHKSSEFVIGRNDMKWPYLDIYFYDENSTHIWDLNHPSIQYLKTFILPLRKIPFMGFQLAAPHKTRLILEKLYKLNVCKWEYHRVIPRHPQRKTDDVKEVPCDLLMDKYPFVKRRDIGNGVLETLEVNGTIVPGQPPFFLEHSPSLSENSDTL